MNLCTLNDTGPAHPWHSTQMMDEMSAPRGLVAVYQKKLEKEGNHQQASGNGKRTQLQHMVDGTDLLEEEGVVVSQSTSECCRFYCCQPNIDWKVLPNNAFKIFARGYTKGTINFVQVYDYDAEWTPQQEPESKLL